MSLSSALGVDSVKLRLIDYEVCSDNKLKIGSIEDNSIANEDKHVGDYLLYADKRGNRAWKNDEFTGARFNLGYRKGIKHCTVEFSAPRILSGDNYNPAVYQTFVDSLYATEDWLREIGIKTNIENSKLARLDVTKNNYTIEEPISYLSLLMICGMTGAVKRDYGTTVTWMNTVQQICFYDKLNLMRSEKLTTRGLPNTLRAELRLMTGKKIRDYLGFDTAGDLMSGDAFQHLADKYYQSMRKNIFKHSSSEVDCISRDSIIQDLQAFKSNYKSNYLSKYVKAVGINSIVSRCSVDTFLNALRMVDTARGRSKERKIKRYKREFETALVDIKLIQTDLFTGRTNSELYQELKNIALAVA